MQESKEEAERKWKELKKEREEYKEQQRVFSYSRLPLLSQNVKREKHYEIKIKIFTPNQASF